jgi:hypothetical protein
MDGGVGQVSNVMVISGLPLNLLNLLLRNSLYTKLQIFLCVCHESVVVTGDTAPLTFNFSIRNRLVVSFTPRPLCTH